MSELKPQLEQTAHAVHRGVAKTNRTVCAKEARRQSILVSRKAGNSDSWEQHFDDEDWKS